MIFKNETIKFDGKVSGIIVQIKNAYGNKIKYITFDQKVSIFNNLEVAKIMAPNIIKDGEFSYWIKNGEMLVNINQCKYDNKNHIFQYIDSNNGVVYNFKELRSRTLSNLGYIIFDDGDTKRSDRTNYWKRQSELLSFITYSASGLLGEKWDEYGITNIDVRKKEIVLSIKSTTTTIHILTNSYLMDINQERTAQREQDPRIKRIPFIKTMDKYSTFYVFSSRDVCEVKKLNGEEKAKVIIDALVEDLQRSYPDALPKQEKISYDIYINMED